MDILNMPLKMIAFSELHVVDCSIQRLIGHTIFLGLSLGGSSLRREITHSRRVREAVKIIL